MPDPLDAMRERSKPARTLCSVRVLLNKLDDDVAAAVSRALEAASDPEDEMTFTGIASWLKDEHEREIGSHTLARHARGDCKCAADA